MSEKKELFIKLLTAQIESMNTERAVARALSEVCGENTILSLVPETYSVAHEALMNHVFGYDIMEYFWAFVLEDLKYVHITEKGVTETRDVSTPGRLANLLFKEE